MARRVSRLGAGDRGIPTWLLVAFPTAVAAIANFLWIGRQSLWQDEGFTANMVIVPWSEFWSLIFTHSEGNMVGYHLLLRFWPLHENEAGLRSFSALCIVASVPLVFWIGNELGGRAAGWWAASFFALWLFIVRYGQEARSYSLLVLVTLAATAALLKATRSDARRWWAAWGVLLSLGLYVHIFGALMVLPHAVWIVMQRPPRRRVALAAGVALLVASPMLVYLPFHFGTTNIDWIQRPTRESLWLRVILPLTGYSYYMLAALIVAATGLGAVVFLRQRDELPKFAFLMTWASLPLLVALGYSLLVRPVLQANYVIEIVPALPLLLGIAITKIPTRIASAVAGVLVLVICARSMEQYYSGFLKPEIREAAALVASQTRPGDAVVEGNGLQPALDYYWRNVQRPTAGLSGSRLWVIAPGEPTPPESVAADWHLMWRQNLYQIAVALYMPASEADSREDSVLRR
jgi:mannosyltransferase